MTKLTEQAENRDLSSRKPYATPTLVTYGDIREVTQNVAMNNNPDSGPPNPGNTKTS